MWALVNRTPYAAERSWTRDRDGHHVWLVAVKATYDLDVETGALRLSAVQPPPSLEPVHFGEPGASSLRFDVDLVEPKVTTDVIVNASAYAPRPTRRVEVGLKIGNLTKVLVVHGPRVYWQSAAGLGVSEAQEFVHAPIRWEWAYGGTDRSDADPRNHRMDARNPVGRGVAFRAASLVHREAHRIEGLDGRPAGFGAIAAHWSPRRELAGTFDEAWQKQRRPLLPLDHDPRVRQCAPDDQRPREHLRGGEAIALSNMTPRGTLVVRVPTVKLSFLTLIRALKEGHSASLGTVVIEPDEKKLTCVWQTALPVGPRDLDHLDATIVSVAT